MRTACWMAKVTSTHSEYVILVPFRQQQWYHERASALRYTYIARFVQFVYDISETVFTYIKFDFEGDSREYLYIPQRRSAALGIIMQAGTMWDVSDAGVRRSGKIPLTVTGLENDCCENKVTQDFVHVDFKNKTAQTVLRYVGPHAVNINKLYNNLAHVKAGVFILQSPTSRNEGQSSVPGCFIRSLCNTWTYFPQSYALRLRPPLISVLYTSVTQNFFARGPFVVSKNSHGSSHPYWRKCSVSWW
jgi:hypothetical protein